MIESKVIELLDFGDLVQNIDAYSKNRYKLILNFFRRLTKHKPFPMIIEIILIILFFIQIWTQCIIHIPINDDIILKILDYLKKVTIFYEIITNKSNYIILIIVVSTIIIIDVILMLIIIFSKGISFLIYIINFINIIIYYYLIGPMINVSLASIWCENNEHKYLQSKCFSNPIHLCITILSFVILLIYLIVAFMYTFYSSEIESITENIKENTFRINCNYEIFCLISKIFIFIFGFFIRKNGNKIIYKSLYEGFIFLNCLIMSIYTYINVYYYNYLINIFNHFGWYTSASLSFSILLKTLLNLNGISNFIIFGWIIVIIALYKNLKLKEYSLLTEMNIFEFKDVKLMEMYKNILLDKLSEKMVNNSKILIIGIFKKFEEFSKSNPELYYQYKILCCHKNLIKKFNKDDDMPIIAIIYILYSYYSEKFSLKVEITLHFCYFLIRKFNNFTYAMLLCSKLKTEGLKDLYYKYLLIEDIKEHLIIKLTKNSKKESLKHVQIGSVILFYLYIELFRMKIYDATTSQIDYFDLLKSNITTNKTTENFLKSSETILNSRKEIINIWDKIIELNPFSDEYQKDYMLYLDTIIQDDFLSKEESKKYILKKNSKTHLKNSIYHKMFLTDKSSVLLSDGYLSSGKIIYASPNFPLIFMYTQKEILSLFIDDLLPSVVQAFHKDLIEKALKYSNINYVFKKPKNSLLKTKSGGLFNIKFFVKPVPNLYYGLIYYIFIEKINDSNFIMVIDKDLKINGFTEISQTGSLFIMSNAFNLSHSILGYNIGLIIPDILPLLEFKNDEFNITKQNCELKGYLYQVEKTKELRNKIHNVLDKIKSSHTSLNEYQGQINLEEDPVNIRSEYNEFIIELNKQNNRPISIYYRVKLFTFMENKYKYYTIEITNNIISENEYGISTKLIKEMAESHSEKYRNNFGFRSSISKISKDSKKRIKVISSEKKPILTLNNKANKIENSKISKNTHLKNNKNQNEIKEDEDSDGNINIDKKKNQYKSLSLYNSKSNIAMSGFNKIKNDIINKKEIMPLKLMKYLCYLFCLMTIIFMVWDLLKKINSFYLLSNFLIDNVFFNKTKVAVASLYIISVNIRWLSHSIFENSTSCLHGNWIEFYQTLLKESLKYIEIQKNNSHYLDDDFYESLNKKSPIELEVHRIPEKEKYDFCFDNKLSFLINSIIKILDIYDYFMASSCRGITPILGLNETKLQNLIDQAYNFYSSNLGGFKGKEKLEKIDKKFSGYLIPLFIYMIFLLGFLSFYIYYALDLYQIEIYFLEKLINFNSPNLENYIKKLDEIKKKLRNDNSEEEEKAEDMDFNDLESKKKEEEDNEIKEAKKNEKEKKKKKKRGGNNQNKIQQIKKKKLKIMTTYFFRKNLFFIIKIFIIMIFAFSYFILVYLLKSKFRNDLLIFDDLIDSIYGVYRDCYDMFISFKRELDLYERGLINCTAMNNTYQIQLPNSNNITTPKFGNLLMRLTGTFNSKNVNINNFNLLYSGNACKILTNTVLDMEYCEKYWSGILLKGMEQAITHMGVIISSILNELQVLKEIKNPVVLFSLMNQSSFITYEQFTEYYLLRAYNKTTYIFRYLRDERLKSIINVMKYIIFVYAIVSIFLFIVLFLFVSNYKYIFNLFLNFAGIFPAQYLSEDQNIFREIIAFGNRYF